MIKWLAKLQLAGEPVEFRRGKAETRSKAWKAANLAISEMAAVYLDIGLSKSSFTKMEIVVREGVKK